MNLKRYFTPQILITKMKKFFNINNKKSDKSISKLTARIWKYFARCKPITTTYTRILQWLLLFHLVNGGQWRVLSIINILDVFSHSSDLSTRSTLSIFIMIIPLLRHVFRNISKTLFYLIKSYIYIYYDYYIKFKIKIWILVISLSTKITKFQMQNKIIV